MVNDLRLLVIASTFPAYSGDGTPAFVRDLAKYQARHFSTLVLTPRIPGGPAYEQIDERLCVRRFPYFPRRWESVAHGAIIENLRSRPSSILQVPSLIGAEALAVRAAVRTFRPHVVHAHWIVPQALVAIAAARSVPLVVTTLGGDIYALSGAFWRPVHAAVLKRAFAVTTMNEDMKKRLIQLGARSESTYVMPMGTDLDTIRSAGTDVQPVHGRILVAARLVEKKGVHVLLDAVRGLPFDAQWSLDIVGDGPMRSALEAQANGMPVRFVGQLSREALGRSLHEAEIFVVPSVPASSGDQDGLPVVLLDAMAAGRAIVASRLPGIDEAVEDGASGVLVTPGDASQLSSVLAALLSDPARRGSLQTGARKRAEKYSVDKVGQRYVDLIKAAAGT